MEEGFPEVAAEETVVHEASKYIVTASGNRISRASSLKGAQHISAAGKCFLAAGSTLRGDVAKISLGKYCELGENSVLHPAEKQYDWGLSAVPQKFGNHVRIGAECTVRAASVGSAVLVGDRCSLGPRCIVSHCVRVDADSVVPADAVLAPFTRWRGAPAQLVGLLDESFLVQTQRQLERDYASTVMK